MIIYSYNDISRVSMIRRVKRLTRVKYICKYHFKRVLVNKNQNKDHINCYTKKYQETNYPQPKLYKICTKQYFLKRMFSKKHDTLAVKIDMPHSNASL